MELDQPALLIMLPPQTPSTLSSPGAGKEDDCDATIILNTYRKARASLQVSQPLECDRCGYILHLRPKEDMVSKLASHYQSFRCQKGTRARKNRQARDYTRGRNSSTIDCDDKDDKGSQTPQPRGTPQLVSCYQCDTSIELTKARYHVGQHILRALLGVKENLKQKVSPATACGFCGRSGTCRLILPDESLQAPPEAEDVDLIFSCKRARMQSRDQEERYSPVTPSTNVPVACGLCLDLYDAVVENVVFWKFGIFHHIETAHPEHWDRVAQRVKTIPDAFGPFISISQRELCEVAPDAPLRYPGPVTET